jgi:hypothetical protein
MQVIRRPVALLVTLLVAACSNAPALTAATVSPTPSATIAATAGTPDPLAPPTYVRWGVDKSGDSARPYFLDLFYNGVATSFRVIDAAGKVVLQLPIAGSGIFGPETCIVRARPGGKEVNATWMLLDVVGREHFEHDGPTYRVEVDTVGGRTLTLPLTDSGCRPL